MTTPIPSHLADRPWYAPHLAWLRDRGFAPRHEPGDAVVRRADLSGAYLSGADLRGADLRRADLRGAYLSGARGLPPAPIVPDIDRAILAAIEAGGTLDMLTWHTCETTHCRAGWAIHLAGDAGRALEDVYGANVAGALIYTASRPGQRVPDWYASDADAMADMRRAAGVAR